jgi:hypothetical protein
MANVTACDQSLQLPVFWGLVVPELLRLAPVRRFPSQMLLGPNRRKVWLRVHKFSELAGKN